MINFVDSRMATTVESSCIAEDYHEASNLISSDTNSWNRGFMAYSVIKPPVDLTFTFECPVNLYGIKLWTKSGALKSTAFEIFARTNKLSDFDKIGACYDLHDEDGVLFLNSGNDSKVTEKLRETNQFKVAELFHGRKVSLIEQETLCLRISIKRTLRCVPVLKKVQVFGVPSEKCDKHVKQMIVNRYFHLDNSSVDNVPSENHPVEDVDTQDTKELQIPPEFLDAITFEIMNIPMVLPSGNVVDQFTLNKYNQSQEMYGRLPSDPFTGSEFTSSRKPIFNAALKSRIDEFLIVNSDHNEIRRQGRVLGTGQQERKLASKIQFYSDQMHENKRINDHSNYNCRTNQMELRGLPLNEATKLASSFVTKYVQDRKRIKLEESECCVRCRSTANLYKLESCGHLVCKVCANEILTSSSSNCSKCNLVIKSSDLVKFNKVSI